MLRRGFSGILTASLDPGGGGLVRRAHEFGELPNTSLGLLPLLLRDGGSHLPAARLCVRPRPRGWLHRGESALPLRDLDSVEGAHRREPPDGLPRDPAAVAGGPAVVNVDEHLACQVSVEPNLHHPGEVRPVPGGARQIEHDTRIVERVRQDPSVSIGDQLDPRH